MSSEPAQDPRDRQPVPAEGGAVARCPRCGARIAPGIAWCGQCHVRLQPPAPDGGSAETAPVRSAPVEKAPGGGLVGGRVPDATLDVLITRLAEESEPVLTSRALALTGRSWQITVGVGGACLLVLALVGVPVLLARLF